MNDSIAQEDKVFWFKEMDEWRESGEYNVYQFPGIIRTLGFGGISKKDAEAMFTEWSKQYA